jgi:hypothetical protein
VQFFIGHPVDFNLILKKTQVNKGIREIFYVEDEKQSNGKIYKKVF